MSLSKKQISSVVHLLNDTVMRLIDVVDNGAELTVQDATILRNALCKEICGMNMDDILHCDKNARRLLLKRGNADENDGYVGLSGEVTVDTDMQTLRVHDGVKVGGVPVARMSDIPEIASADYVVAWQNPTAENGYIWYRKYRSGWIEQGCGLTQQEASTVVTHVLPLEMANANYTIVITGNRPTSTTGGYSMGVDSVTATGFKTRGSTNSSSTANTFSWYVCGVGV